LQGLARDVRVALDTIAPVFPAAQPLQFILQRAGRELQVAWHEPQTKPWCWAGRLADRGRLPWSVARHGSCFAPDFDVRASPSDGEGPRRTGRGNCLSAIKR